MQFVNLSFDAPSDEVISFISDNNRINSGVKFEEKNGIPVMRVTEKDKKVRITCELTGLPTKDNGFLIGTYFSGKLTEENGRTALKGVILTAPIYHLFFFAMLAVMVVLCIVYSALPVMPLIFVIFEFMMFSREFKKQGYIKRYLLRAEARYKKKADKKV